MYVVQRKGGLVVEMGSLGAEAAQTRMGSGGREGGLRRWENGHWQRGGSPGDGEASFSGREDEQCE
jgi:hypothetical protein